MMSVAKPTLKELAPIEHGASDREAEPMRVVVVEPLAVREWIAAEMLGLDVETLRAKRKAKDGPPCRKAGGAVIYLLDELREWAKGLPAIVSL